MKTLVKIFYLMAVFSLVAGCDKTDELISEDTVVLKSGKTITVTVPLKLEFYSIEAEDANTFVCDGVEGSEEVWMNAHQIGKGNGTHLGSFSVDTKQCYCITDENPVRYKNVIVVFVAANGDELYGRIDEGLVYAVPDPFETGIFAVFNDPMVITGGTGRFAGASGGGNMDSYLPIPGTQWEHSIDGTITMVKGKR